MLKFIRYLTAVPVHLPSYFTPENTVFSAGNGDWQARLRKKDLHVPKCLI
jgi:hypothetical protein